MKQSEFKVAFIFDSYSSIRNPGVEEARTFTSHQQASISISLPKSQSTCAFYPLITSNCEKEGLKMFLRINENALITADSIEWHTASMRRVVFPDYWPDSDVLPGFPRYQTELKAFQDVLSMAERFIERRDRYMTEEMRAEMPEERQRSREMTRVLLLRFKEAIIGEIERLS